MKTIALVMALVWIGASASSAHAQAQTAQCQVLEIEASNGTTGVDAALKPLEKKLKKPPFSSWKAFKLLKKQDKAIIKLKPFEVALVPGAKLTLLYKEKTTAKGNKSRLRVGFTLDDKSGTRVLDGNLNFDVGDWNLLGGDKLEAGGTYIVALSCN